MFRRYYPHFVEISRSYGYYSHFVDIIYIGHITSYLALNVRPIFHIYSFSESDRCILEYIIVDIVGYVDIIDTNISSIMGIFIL